MTTQSTCNKQLRLGTTIGVFKCEQHYIASEVIGSKSHTRQTKEAEN